MKGININPREIKKELDENISKNYCEYSDMDSQIKKEIRDYLDKEDLWLTDEQIKNSKYPDTQCSICLQNGCDHKVSYKNKTQNFHKRCFKLFCKKALKYAKQKYRK